MPLPGGWFENGRCRRDFAFRTVTGSLELALTEAGENAPSWPASVTSALTLVLEHLGGRKPARENVAALCTADRRFLLRRLQIHLGQGQAWRRAACSSCAESFDFFLDVSSLPVKAAGPGYPFATVRLGKENHRFRLPIGSDQEAIASMEDEVEARWELLRRCWVPAPGRGKAEWQTIRKGGASAFERIEAALESVSPIVLSEVEAACPACGHKNLVDVDAGKAHWAGSGDLLREVHQLAFHYHWSEEDILDLGRPRRHSYLALIDQARGMAR